MSKDAGLSEKDFLELEARGGLVPVNQTPVINPALRPAGGPPAPQTQPPQFAGSLPQNLQLQPDIERTAYGGSVPTFRLMPVAPSGLPSVNAGAQTQAAIQVAPVQQQATAAVTTANKALAIAVANTFVGAYSGTATYVPGNQVTYNGSYYLCISTTTGNLPTNTMFWQLVSSPATEDFLGAYSGATAYVPGNQVTYLGSYWICILNSTGNAPSTTSTFWTLVGTSVILIGAWSSSTAYVEGNQTTLGGNVYQCILANTNHTPPNATYWQLMGPATLDDLSDGSSNFSATASTLSYRPTSNPLTATDAGSNATVSIAAFTMQTSSKGSISVNSGSITTLSYSTFYYIYYDDPTLAGGTVTFHATTSQQTALTGTGRFLVGSIITPQSGGTATVGNNDGGTGAQSGTYNLVFFSTGTTTVNTGTVGGSALGNMLDGDSSTSGNITTTGSNNVQEYQYVISLPVTATQIFTSATLFMKSSVLISGSGGTFSGKMEYSTDGGQSWATVYSVSANRALTVDSVSLTSPVNLSRVQVRITVQSAPLAAAATITYYEGWLAVVF